MRSHKLLTNGSVLVVERGEIVETESVQQFRVVPRETCAKDMRDAPDGTLSLAGRQLTSSIIPEGRLGTVSGPSRGRLRTVSEPSEDRLVTVSGPSQDRLVTVLGPSQDHLRTVWGLSGDR
ncbi:hypothetical protein ElyMa_004375200 [Elysia marginata]|uniref:K Homology domain-containing protein n=1 Tax=Elysia marginata TaxID=1093978 RepID=A0AAV4H6U3_9GAST|nr:hypothetical protein ElyMa_004375200 [Elysia marginata]